MYRRIAVATVVLTLMALAAPAVAGKPVVKGEIWIDSPTVAAARTAEAGDVVSYGDTVVFDHLLTGKMAKKYHLTIGVKCYQDGAMVYENYGAPGFRFKMQDNWTNKDVWDGTDASCTAFLRYFAQNKMTIVGDMWFTVVGA